MDLNRAHEANSFAVAVAAEIPRLRRFARVLAKRADLADGETGHHTIAGNRKVREAVVREVLRACPPRRG